jgi:putative GTP pyrophosphokinase
MKNIDPLRYSKSKTDEAGKILCNNNSSEEEKNNALEVLSNWRASHSYPMHVFKKRLKLCSEKINKNALTSQRLKRVPSIINKLKRVYNDKATMKLTQMQDIAGCRTILSDVNLAEKLYKEYYHNGDLKHKKINQKNYILYPKEDGYRSIHIIYKYFSDKKNIMYNGLLIEVQIRSKIQHIWATAVETVDFFTGQAIKSNEGEEHWKDFFRLVSSAFAIIENKPLVPNTPINKKELYEKIREKEKELRVITKMEEWTKSFKEFENSKKNADLFLLELDTLLKKITITQYSKREEEKAIKDYAEAEKKIYGKKEYDVVLVGADSFVDLKNAYPNYFLDIKEFLKYLKKIIAN